MNVALMTAHVGSILSRRNSLWVDWVHDYRLKGKNFWVCKIPSNCSSSWRKLLQMRPSIRSYMWMNIGSGADTSAWYDNWCSIGPLGNFLTPHTITNAGYCLDDKVADVRANGGWSWPNAWRDLFPVLNQVDNVNIDPNKVDKLLWRDGDDLNEITTSGVWHSIRYRTPEVEWSSVVWFAQCIPRHAFLMWLIMRGKLLTQDKILQWDLQRRKNMNMMCCLLCYQNNDSHSHLFFECNFSAQVWCSVRKKVGMDSVNPKWPDIIEWLMPRARSKSVTNYAARLLVAASAYIIWQERNARIFMNQLRPPEVISEIILNTVRYKLMGAKLRNTTNVQRVLAEWKIGGNSVSDDGG
ncbi:uncharacterized protein LOC110914554 [Helianthus annuus]|uniref:uncharacterized protein LOC110914554 n=1 Tax=Helianthus annuus TaxID=4232 RepID=UPI000B908879|nr:uncharacterized protein LOC110914554 [Helianthus annuus]